MWGTGSINIVCTEGDDRAGLQRALDDLHWKGWLHWLDSVFGRTFQSPSVLEVSTFIGLFCLKLTLVQPTTVVEVSLSGTKKSWKVWGGNCLLVSNSAQKKRCQFHWSGQHGSNFKIHWLVLSKGYIGSAKKCGRTFILWHWILVSNSAYQKC